MKSAEEWSREDPLFKITIHLNHPVMIEFIERIQLDAFKAGAEWAAEIVAEIEWGYDGDCGSECAILSASSNLKEIPK